MKNIFRFLTATALLFCFSAYWAVSSPILPTGRDRTDQTADSVALKNHVLALCGTPDHRNSMHSKSLNAAADYIHEYLKLHAPHTEEQAYEVYRGTYRNIIASFGPREGKRFVIGAHYDVCDEQPGADDNASGVAGLLELAVLLSNNQDELTMPVDLVAYTLEEPPFFRTYHMGSAQHAKMLHDEGIEVEGMISLEMIGYYSDAPNSQRYPSKAIAAFYPDEGNFITVVGQLFNGSLTRKIKRGIWQGADIPVCAINAPKSIEGIDFSDHLNYWAYGWDAVMITDTAFMRNKAYHTKKDTPDRLNYGKMAEVVEGVYYGLWKIVAN